MVLAASAADVLLVISCRLTATSMVVQGTRYGFRAILPGGDDVQRGLNVIKLATYLTQNDKGARILWTTVADVRGNASCKMPPIHDIQLFRGGRRELYLGSLTASWLWDQRKEADSLILCLSYNRRTWAAWAGSCWQALHQPRLCPSLRWERATFELAVGHAHPAVAQVLLNHPCAQDGAGVKGWTVPASCPPSRTVQLVRPCCHQHCGPATGSLHHHHHHHHHLQKKLHVTCSSLSVARILLTIACLSSAIQIYSQCPEAEREEYRFTMSIQRLLVYKDGSVLMSRRLYR